MLIQNSQHWKITDNYLAKYYSWHVKQLSKDCSPVQTRSQAQNLDTTFALMQTD